MIILKQPTHNIFYILNTYAEILKILEKNGITYSDWFYLKDQLNFGVTTANEDWRYTNDDPENPFAKKLHILHGDDAIIKYSDIIPNGKYPPLSEDDYFIKNSILK